MGKETKVNPQQCETCQISPQQVKELKRMLKNKVGSKNCPYIKTCVTKRLKKEWELLCKDKEKINGQVSRQAMQVHMMGRHLWEMCDSFLDKLREKEGKLPKNW